MTTCISADSHVTEPPDTYVDRIDPAYRDRAPRLHHDDTLGDVMLIDNGHSLVPYWLVAAAGRPADEIRLDSGRTFAELHRGGWDPEARLGDQDTDGVSAEVVYPSVGMLLCNHPDVDYKHACFEAYNRWIAEFCAYAPARLVGLGQTALRTPEDGIRDLEAIRNLGLRGVMLPGVPPNADYDDPMYDEFWDAVVDSGLPPSFHILTSGTDTPFAPNIRGPKLNSFMAILRGNQDIVGTLVFGAVFERHPDLRVVCVEADAGWLPHYMYRADHAYDRHRNWLTAGELSKAPSEYLRENVYLTFQDDWVAFRVAELMNVERLMWANDFPHSDATWPDSQALLAEHAQHLSADARDRILHRNAADLYGITLERMDTDALIAAGVYDPDAPGAAERLELLRWLLDQGVTLDDIVDADRRGSLYRAGLDALLWPDSARLTVAELAAAAGLPEETVRRARRLIGLADPGDERLCRASEVEMLRAIGNAITLFGEEPALQFTRALGTSTAAIAEAAISLFAVSVAEPMRAAGASSVEYAERVREATLVFTTARSALDVMMRLQFDEAVDRLTGQWGDTTELPRDQVQLTIAFVDLADSTRLTIAAESTAFAAAVRDFEGSAAEAAARHGARLVKLIGDSAMIAAPDATHVADAAGDLVATIAHDDRFRGAHGGIASGLVVARNGDYFGPPANLAARLTEASEPGEILCDAPTAAALGRRAVPAGSRVLRGFDAARPVYSLLPPAAQPPSDDT